MILPLLRVKIHKMMKAYFFNISTILVLLAIIPSYSQSLKIAKLKYNGGGDWYANKTALPNLIKFCNQNLNLNLTAEEDIVEASSKDIFNYPYVYMTGHGNVVF